LISNCYFTSNQSSLGGGAIVSFHREGILEVANCLFDGNTETGDNTVYPQYEPFGGAGVLALDGANTVLTNCTFTRNVAHEAGSAVRIGIIEDEPRPSRMTLRNCIVWDNATATALVDIPLAVEDPSIHSLVAASSIIQGGAGPFDAGYNLDVDPQFVDPDAGDFTLQNTSPAIDAGDNLALPLTVTEDLSGLPRYVDHPLVADTGLWLPPVFEFGPIDLGAYEYQYACPGDIDGDLQVDGDDFFYLLQHWGMWQDAGDLDGDHRIDVDDFFLLLQHWGQCG
jgi:hypothetical protein